MTGFAQTAEWGKWWSRSCPAVAQTGRPRLLNVRIRTVETKLRGTNFRRRLTLDRRAVLTFHGKGWATDIARPKVYRTLEYGTLPDEHLKTTEPQT